MRVKDIIPIIVDDIVIWICGYKRGRWTMPREILIESDGENEINKIDIVNKEIMLYINNAKGEIK